MPAQAVVGCEVEDERVECRLLYLVGQLRAGGLERQLYYLLRTMDRERYQPVVAVWNFREDDVYVPQIRALGVPLIAVPRAPSAIAKLRAFRQLVKQLRPEVVHSYSFYTNFAAYWGTRGRPAVPVGSVRSDFARAKKEAGLLLGRLSARWPQSQIFNSHAAADRAQRARGLFVPQRLFTVRNGLDLQHFCSSPVPTTGRARIVGVGSLSPVKRWDRLLRAASALKQQGLDFLVQIGGDGPLRNALAQQIQDLGLSDYVELLGHVHDVPSVLSQATFLAHTSDSEGCPNVVMEAMACGRAVVATDVGDVPFLVEDGKIGFVVRCEDDMMLVSCLAALITDRDLCCRMGKGARVRAEQEYGLDYFVAATFAAYQKAGWIGPHRIHE